MMIVQSRFRTKPAAIDTSFIALIFMYSVETVSPHIKKWIRAIVH